MKRSWIGLVFVAGCADSSVKKPYQEKDLTVEEIRRKLDSGDFRQRLEAAKQIDKLEAEERLRVLLALAGDSKPSTRLLAVKKLKAVGDPRARERLRKMAKEDPDADVRELAGG